MNYGLLCRLLGIICLLIGGSMAFCLPFAWPYIAQRTHSPLGDGVEWVAIRGFLASITVCLLAGAGLMYRGRHSKGNQLFRKEAMAVVGLSWVFATLLGALPFYFSGTQTAPNVPITFIESMFEAQSGFSTTGATILTELENPKMVSHCVLFWRSMTHFLGGLGIVVLFVAILGQGSAGKAMMRAEIPGPTKEGNMPRIQHTALVFAAIYVSLNIVLTLIYALQGMTVFDSLCHAFATMATGGFSTYNQSIGRFDSSLIEYTTVLFMILAGTNFTLLYFCTIGQPGKLFRDVEFQTFVGFIVVITLGVIFFGMNHGDPKFDSVSASLRFGLFQVVSIITTTGYGTANFDSWNNFGRGSLLLLMFVGGCAGSTGGGLKVIRHVLFYKVLCREIEKAHHPRVVRPLRVGGSAIDDPDLARNIMVYFSLILAIFVVSWMLLVTFEPDHVWEIDDVSEVAVATLPSETDVHSNKAPLSQTSTRQGTLDEKLLDLASAVAATLNNIGPGLGVVGTTKNYSGFSQGAKLLFVWLMMLGRVEVFSVLVLIFPGFWRRY